LKRKKRTKGRLQIKRTETNKMKEGNEHDEFADLKQASLNG